MHSPHPRDEIYQRNEQKSNETIKMAVCLFSRMNDVTVLGDPSRLRPESKWNPIDFYWCITAIPQDCCMLNPKLGNDERKAGFLIF